MRERRARGHHPHALPARPRRVDAPQRARLRLLRRDHGGITIVEGDAPDVVDVFLFGIGASIAFALANTAVTRGFRVRVEDEPPIVLALGTSLGVVSVTVAIGVAALVAWLLNGWLAWLLVLFAATAAYLLATAAEFVLARIVRDALGRERLEER